MDSSGPLRRLGLVFVHIYIYIYIYAYILLIASDVEEVEKDFKLVNRCTVLTPTTNVCTVRLLHTSLLQT